MKKKSQGHVEMVLSVVIFVGFLIFIFIFIQPFSFSKKDISLTTVEKVIFNEIEEVIGELSVITGSDSDCYELIDVLDDYGTNFAEVHDSTLRRKYTIYFGDFFDESVNGIISCSESATRVYTLGVYTERTFVRFENIIDLKNEYETNYNELKQRLGVGDFVFTVYNSESNLDIEELSVVKTIPDNSEVVAENIPVLVIDKFANIYEYIIHLRAW